MQTQSIKKGWPGLIIAMAIMGILAGGCQNCKKSFRQSFNGAIESIQAGDIQTAQKHIDAMRPCAKSYEKKRVVAGLNDLVGGAKQMMEGDVPAAKKSWSSIDDPQLNREVRIKAYAVMGVEVPLISNKKETKK